MEDSSVEEMPDIIIPPVEVNMVVGEESILLNNDVDDASSIFNDYKEEMMQSGLESSDVKYLDSAYKNLEDVKFIRMHCTSCDKHIGSAPNDIQNRYEHPLLKVLICGDCFQFYSSGDFEKDEDGSELYCRWCGEGGQVFCCTKCPFVFCKKCIRRNLGRGIAKMIENSDNWMCFSCDASQISRHRATYWAVQKYSDEMIKRAKIADKMDHLSVDENICCSAVKKRQDVYNKLMQPPKKKQKCITTVPTFQTALDRKPSTSKPKQVYKNNATWNASCISAEPEDEVICTPDIIPLDESPPHSPERIESPVPVVQQDTPVSVPIVTQVPPLLVRPPVPTNMSISDLQKHLQSKYTQIILTPRGKPPIRNNQPLILRKPTPLLPNTIPQNNGNYRFAINPKPNTTVPSVANTNIVVGPVNPVTNVQTPVATTSKTVEQNSKDWFDQAVVDCAEVTEYISTKISSLSGVHTRAYKSEKLMEELHNTFQTYMHVAIEKVNKIRRVMQSNFEKDMEKNFKNEKIVNPFATKHIINPENSSDGIITSDDSNSADSFKHSKTRYVLTKNIKPEDVLFDMDVTNASDEENQSSKTSSRTTPNEGNKLEIESDSEDDVQEVTFKKKNDIIHIIDSDDEIKEVNSEPNIVSDDLLEKIRAKFNIKNIPSKELIKYLSAVIVVTNKINTEIEEIGEISNSKISLNTGDLQRNIESKLIIQIQKLLEEPITEDICNEESNINNDDTKTIFCKQVEKVEYDEQKEINSCEEHNSLEEFDYEPQGKEGKEKLLNELDSDVPSETIVNNSINKCSDDQYKDVCDIEDILGSNVVLRTKKSAASFGDEFSKFVCEKVEESDVSDDMSDSLKDTMNIAEDLDIIPEYINDICNRDNGSLSLPPDSLAELSANEVEMLMKQKDDENEASNKKSSNDIVLNSEILALKQLAENCVNSVDVHKTSTECRG